MSASPAETRQQGSKPPYAVRELSGKWVVVAVIGFAVLATAVLWIYSDLHTAPFRPLTRAIAEHYPDSAPRVEGGRHRNGPMTLRIIMRVDFNPTEHEQRCRQLVGELKALAADYVNLPDFEVFEVHLFQLRQRPRQEIVSQTFRERLEQPSDADSAPGR